MNKRQKELLEDYINSKDNQINQLKQENNLLKERIDNAIEFVEDNIVYFVLKEKVGKYITNCESDKLINILKGDMNEKVKWIFS